MGVSEKTHQTESNVKKNREITPLSEDIYYDKSVGMVRIRISFPEAVDAKIRLINSQGLLIRELVSDGVQLLKEDIILQVNGIYIVAIESDNYRMIKKVFVNN